MVICQMKADQIMVNFYERKEYNRGKQKKLFRLCEKVNEMYFKYGNAKNQRERKERKIKIL